MPLPAHLARPIEVSMIDNFDSFTWNLYQSLCLLDTDFVVIRNDAISPEDFLGLQIRSLISPGPGHPRTDAGVFQTVITYFMGKVPVFGVCVGLECLVDVLCGEIAYAGEVMHRNVSRVRHDNRGRLKDIPQGIQPIRNHSFNPTNSLRTPSSALSPKRATSSSVFVAASTRSKPSSATLRVSCRRVVMSCLQTFLKLRGGTWEENPECRAADTRLLPFELYSTVIVKA